MEARTGARVVRANMLHSWKNWKGVVPLVMGKGPMLRCRTSGTFDSATAGEEIQATGEGKLATFAENLSCATLVRRCKLTYIRLT